MLTDDDEETLHDWVTDPLLKSIDALYTEECRDNELKIMEDLDSQRLYHSRRYYNDGSYRDNAVKGKDLVGHIVYNQRMRFGTALFINGKPVSLGYLGKERCAIISKELLTKPPQMPKHTIPYR